MFEGKQKLQDGGQIWEYAFYKYEVYILFLKRKRSSIHIGDYTTTLISILYIFKRNRHEINKFIYVIFHIFQGNCLMARKIIIRNDTMSNGLLLAVYVLYLFTHPVWFQRP